MKTNSSYIEKTVACALTTALLIAMAGASNVSAANFSKTCNQIALQGNILQANCARPNPRDPSNPFYHRTSLNLDSGIGNNDGVLAWGGTNFSQTCKNITLTSNTVLKADCTRAGVLSVNSILNLDDRINNTKGSLTFD
ncbi:MAG: CVNH domain-containing protein [Trichlorobacter sp.]|uniref:mannose-binding lectin n=1 Tax=Trichlorobacter sp. TaxID=2911007 RepID=UPI00256AFC1B|nr:CVNH domain-containing protein [Trichlorobacter sp.]MDK9717630.1 CVNH domain-containing protein [Trichlorobacter sp.]